jgi:uncharacterized repeat protein (TIGR01451 family)
MMSVEQMMKKLSRMILVFSFSSLVLIMFLTASGIIRVQGAEIEPELIIRDYRELGTSTTIVSPLQRYLAGDGSALLPAAPEADADLEIIVLDDPDPVIAGNPLTYTLVITNHGPSDATGVTALFTFPTNRLDYLASTPICLRSGPNITCELGNLSVGVSIQVILEMGVKSAAVNPLSITASVSSEDNDPIPGNNQKTENTVIEFSSDLTVSTVDEPDPVYPGGTLTYTLTVANSGPSDADGVILTDTLPTEVNLVSITTTLGTCEGTNCTLGTIIAGGSANVTLETTVAITATGIITNTAQVSSLEPDPDTTNNIDYETTTISEAIDLADVAITKSDFPDPVLPGELLTYTLNVINNGPLSATNVIVTDTLPVEVSLVSIIPSQGECVGTVCTLGTILAGGDASVILVTEVNLNASGVITNTAQVSSLETDPQLENNFDEETTTIGEGVDLTVTKSGDPTVIAGDYLDYSITVINLSSTDATNVVLTDTLPGEVTFDSSTPGFPDCTHDEGIVTCSLGTLLAGSSTDVTITVLVDPGASGLLTNTVVVSSDVPDPNPNNNWADENTTVIFSSDLSITKNGDPDQVYPGETLTYTLTITNNGLSNADGVVVTDTLPVEVSLVSITPSQGECVGTVCTLGMILAGGSANVTLVTVVDLAASADIINYAQVSEAFDPNTDNNYAEETTALYESADLAVSTIDDPEPADPGGVLTYTLTVTNNGPFVTSGVTLIDTLPDEVTLLHADPSQGSCAGTICSLGTIAAGNSAQVTLVGLIALDASGVITNTAQVFGQLFDPIPENNLDVEHTTVGSGADLSLTKTASPNPVVAGEILTYSLSIHNQGPSSAPSSTLIDTLPGNVTFLSSIPSAPTCAQSGETVVCNLGTIASGATRNVTIVVQVDASATGSLINQAQVSSITFDPDMVNNSAAEETTVLIPDTVAPTVAWLYPVENEQRYDVGTEILPLEAIASDNVGIQRVDFFWWDPVIEQFIDIGSAYEAPYRVDFDTSVLYYGYNEVDVRAYDTSGNASSRSWIWLYRLDLENLLYLPVIAR